MSISKFLISSIPQIPSPEPEGDLLYILAGESHCGRSQTSQMTTGEATKYAGVSIPQTKIYNRASSTSLQHLQIGVNTMLVNYADTDEFGIESSFLFKRAEIDQRKRYIIKLGYGGSRLYDGWNSRTGTTLWNWLNADIADAVTKIIADGSAPKLAQFIWMQGSNDAVNSTYADAYATNLQNFFDDFRAVWDGIVSANSLPVHNFQTVISKINPGTSGIQVEWPTILSAQETFVASPANNAVMLNTDGVTFFDGTHYDTTSMIRLGIDLVYL